MKSGKFFILAIFSVLITAGFGPSAFGADHYVRQGAAGRNNGSDWTNAWTQLPNTLVRGDAYYIADGTYAPYVFDDPASGTTKITIKKATPNNHGTSTGWINQYGDGQALFTGSGNVWNVCTSHWVFDGVSAANDTSGHGFKLYPTAVDAKGIQIKGAASAYTNVADFLEFRYIEIVGRGMNSGDTDDDCCIYAVSNDANGCTNVLFNHCYLHDVGWVHILTRRCRDWTIEYCYFTRNQSDPGQHACSTSDAQSNNITFRYNTWADCEGTGIIEWIGVSGAGYNADNWKIYGNLFFYHEGNPFRRDGTAAGTISGVSYHTESNCWFVNNTIVNMPGTAGARHYAGSRNCYAYNNLYYKCGRVLYNETPHDYDYYIDTPFAYGTAAQANDLIQNGVNPFTDVRNHIFTLARPTAPGRILPSPFNIDVNGLERSSNGNWDRGVYEYFEGGLISKPTPGSSAGNPPVIASVAITPNSGRLKVGGTVAITVTAAGNTAGLTPSPAAFNGRQVPLSDRGNGVYSGVYTVQSGDNDGRNVEAANITLTGPGGTSAPASSSGSTLSIDAHPPAISSVTLSPSTGTVGPGSTVAITATAGNNEAGLTASAATFLGKNVPLSDAGNGIYRGVYTIQTGDGGGTPAAPEALFEDSFTSGNLSNWSSVSSGILVGSEGNADGRGVEYTIAS
ncbi:MAG: right-handed parallel beta-helix repeat-containing protein, partial [Candidatus Latescibacterota bacterium]